jgi:putative transposase
MNDPNQDRHRRRSIRLTGYDYAAAGAYFVTLCTHGRADLFGDIAGAEMRLNEAGRLVQEVWTGLPEHYPHVELDAWVVMPNHVHGIFFIVREDVDGNARNVAAGAAAAGAAAVGAGFVGAGFKPAPTLDATGAVVDGPLADGAGFVRADFKPALTISPAVTRHGLPEIVRALKTFSARRINAWRNTPGLPVWQRNYYEHIIRDEAALERIRQYIADNPARWNDDTENPAHPSHRRRGRP